MYIFNKKWKVAFENFIQRKHFIWKKTSLDLIINLRKWNLTILILKNVVIIVIILIILLIILQEILIKKVINKKYFINNTYY